MDLTQNQPSPYSNVDFSHNKLFYLIANIILEIIFIGYVATTKCSICYIILWCVRVPWICLLRAGITLHVSCNDACMVILLLMLLLYIMMCTWICLLREAGVLMEWSFSRYFSTYNFTLDLSDREYVSNIYFIIMYTAYIYI